MAKLTPKKIDLSILNNGNKYNKGDGISSEAINSSIESAAYTQALATTQPDVSEANNVGIPSVEIKEINGLPKFKFTNLKGEKGDSGVASGTVNSNTEGTSDTNGYTQQAVNKIASRPNILINPDFSINQRGQKSYTASNSSFYCVDRMHLAKFATPTVTQKVSGGISVSGTAKGSNNFIFTYFVEEYKKYAGKTLTLSVKLSNVTGSGLKIRTASTSTGDYSGSITTDMIYTKTFTVNESPTVLSIVVTTASAGDFSFDIDWWKLEVGSVATAFVPPLIAEELPKCQRYYQRFTPKSDFREYGIGFIASTTSAHFSIPLCCEMRIINPTLSISDVSHLTVRYGSNNGNVVQTSITAVELRSYSKSGFFISTTLANTLSFEYGVASLRSANTNGYISLDAEIYS